MSYPIEIMPGIGSFAIISVPSVLTTIQLKQFLKKLYYPKICHAQKIKNIYK